MVVIQIDRVVELVGRRIDIHNFEILPYRSWLKRRRGRIVVGRIVPWHGERSFVDRRGVEGLADAWIKGIDAQAPPRGRRFPDFPFYRRGSSSGCGPPNCA